MVWLGNRSTPVVREALRSAQARPDPWQILEAETLGAGSTASWPIGLAPLDRVLSVVALPKGIAPKTDPFPMAQSTAFG